MTFKRNYFQSCLHSPHIKVIPNTITSSNNRLIKVRILICRIWLWLGCFILQSKDGRRNEWTCVIWKSFQVKQIQLSSPLPPCHSAPPLPTINNCPLPCSELMSILSLVCHKLGWSDLYSFWPMLIISLYSCEMNWILSQLNANQ